jgi:hypothetical protein
MPALAGVDSPLLEEGVEDGDVDVDVDGSAGAFVEAEAEAEDVAVATVEAGVLETTVPAVIDAPSNCSLFSFHPNPHSHTKLTFTLENLSSSIAPPFSNPHRCSFCGAVTFPSITTPVRFLAR